MVISVATSCGHYLATQGISRRKRGPFQIILAKFNASRCGEACLTGDNRIWIRILSGKHRNGSSHSGGRRSEPNSVQRRSTEGDSLRILRGPGIVVAHSANGSSAVFHERRSGIDVGLREEERPGRSLRPYAAALATRHSRKNPRGTALVDDEASPTRKIIVDDSGTVAKSRSPIRRPSDSPLPSRERSLFREAMRRNKATQHLSTHGSSLGLLLTHHGHHAYVDALCLGVPIYVDAACPVRAFRI